MKCKAKVFIYKRGPNEYRNCTRKAKYKIVWKKSKYLIFYVCGTHKNQFINEYQDDTCYNIIFLKEKKKMSYCKEFLKAFRKTVGAKPEEKIDKRYSGWLAPNNKAYGNAHCGYCAEVEYLSDIYDKEDNEEETNK